jgi:hypothetical protein
MAYWKICRDRIERDGRDVFGDRFISQSFDAFCRDPAAVVRVIYDALGRPAPDLDYSGVHPARGPHQAGSPRWERYRQLLDLPRS